MRTRLSLLIGDRRRLVVALVGCSIVSGFAEAGTLALIADILASLVGGKHAAHGASSGHGAMFNLHASIGTLIIVAFGLCLVRIMLQIPLSMLPARIGADVQARLRAQLFDAFSRASWTVQSREREGQLQETVTGQVMQAVSGATGATGLLMMSIQFTVLMLTALILNAVAAVAVGVTSVLLFGALRPVRARGGRYARRLSKAQVRFAGGIAESNRLAEETHVFGVGDEQRRRIGALVGQTRYLLLRAQTITRLVTNLYQSLIYLLLVGGVAALYLVGGSHAGKLGAVVLLLVRAGTSGQQIQGLYQSLLQSLPFIQRTQDTVRRYEESAEPCGDTPLQAIETVAFERISFAYAPDAPIVLSDVSFEIEGGESIGIVGPSGAGKSTLVQILLRLRPPLEGDYLINGLPADRYVNGDWHRQVSYVPQEPRLLHASVAANIRFFRDIEDAEVERAARLARIHDDIVSWEKGYETIVGPRADAVSGGQQQRICLARALAARPAMLILDEPTSALDPHSEALIGESLLAIRSNLTLIIVAHRMSTLEMCDRVMVILDGRLAGFDTKATLQRDNPYYRHASQLAMGGALG